MNVLGNLTQGLLFIISAPAGTGKSTLAQKVIKAYPSAVARSISCTTRAPRKGEKDGVDYHFVTHEAFAERLEQGAFLEHAEVFGQRYGTLRSEVEAKQNAGKHVLLVIDTQGAMQLKGKLPAVFIFVKPPSHKELEERLSGRKTEARASIERRLSWAERELEQAAHYDYLIVNDDLDVAYRVLSSIIIAEEHKTDVS